MILSKIAVCGSGTMGTGITLAAALAGYPVLLYDVNENSLQKAKAAIQADLEKQVQKGYLTTEQAKQCSSVISYSSSLDQVQGDVIIEAIIENPEIKHQLYEALVKQNSPTTLLASNTSSLSINKLAASLPNPDRFAGLHFFNPPTRMKLVEIVKGENTSQATINTLIQLVKSMKKHPVVCTDSPGFIVNHVARPFYLEALYLVEKGYSSPETVDALMEATGFKMGPFRLMDLIGNDINFTVSTTVYEALGKPPRLQPSLLQKEKVTRGELGRKTGKGYYNYSSHE